MAKKSAVSEYLSSIGKKGGEARVPKGLAMLPESERKVIRDKALATRRKNAAAKGKKAKKKAEK